MLYFFVLYGMIQYYVILYCTVWYGTILSSRHAKRAGWPKGPKGPVGPFRAVGPAGVLRRRLLYRNGTFAPLPPSEYELVGG